MRLLRVLGALVGGAALLAGTASPALAEPTGRIAQVEQTTGGLRVVFLGSDLPDGTSIDPGTVSVELDGTPLDAEATLVTEQPEPVQRTAVLALDTSGSMQGAGLEGAKAAAAAFLDALPPEVAVGLVTFSSTAQALVPTTAAREQVRQSVAGLTADGDTALYDAVVLAARALPTEGVRHIVLLTDGTDDGSTTTIDAAAAAVRDAEITLTAVSFGTQADQTAALNRLADAGQGGVIATDAAADLATAFEQAAREIGDQLVVDIAVPEQLEGRSGNLTIRADAGGAAISASAFTEVAAAPAPVPPVDGSPARVAEPPRVLTWPVLVVGLGALFVALTTIAAASLATATRGRRPGERVLRRLSIYTLTGRPPKQKTEHASRLGTSPVARSAVQVAGRVVDNRDLEGLLGSRLEAGGIPLKSAEWLLIHLGVAIGTSLLFLLASGGSAVAMALGLVPGLVGPWLFLSLSRSRRENAFLAALPDTLQLLAGSLQAGYSIPQALDTVAREGQDPIAGELNRALVEARLGVPIDEALQGVATRMGSRDFSWVVMAIRIQREVGGNLAEVLTTVSDTLRERDRLRRQVQTLSAEGRLSAWILGVLPVAFAAYLVVAQPRYLAPLVTDVVGIVILVAGAVLLAIGVFWLSKVVKVEV